MFLRKNPFLFRFVRFQRIPHDDRSVPQSTNQWKWNSEKSWETKDEKPSRCFVIYLLPFLFVFRWQYASAHHQQIKERLTICLSDFFKTISELQMTTSLTKRLSSFPLISLRRRFLRRRPPFSRSDAKPNSNIQNRPSNCGRARRCPSTKSETKGGKYEINDVFSCPVLFPFVNQLASNEWNYTLINSSLEEAAKYFVISFHFSSVIQPFNKRKAKCGNTIVKSSNP